MATPADAMAMKHFHKLWSQAKRVVVLTGAGVSAESGIPTFRGEGGLWRKYVSEFNSVCIPLDQTFVCQGCVPNSVQAARFQLQHMLEAAVQ